MKNQFLIVFLFLAVQLVFLSCEQDADLSTVDGISSAINSLPEQVTYPANNPYSEEKAALGRLLFWDPILSGNKDIACVSCHHPDFGYADGLKVSLGVGGNGLGPNRRNGIQIARNSPTIINTAFNGIDNNGNYAALNAPMFWDNRANSLEEQALQPMLSKEEMRGTTIAETDIMEVIVQRLNSIPEYKVKFKAAFGEETINQDLILKAIATFERGIVANNSRFDQYMRGNTNILSSREIEGMQRFVEVGCADCHSGPMFSDFELHTIGIPNKNNDEGANGRFDFRTPTLRNLGTTGPYMHNGLFSSLEDVVDFYEDLSDGRRIDNNNQNLDEEIRDLEIRGRDVDEIVAFLSTLNDLDFDSTTPDSVPSGLTVGGNID